jgi:hypothetical protein
LLRRKHSIPYKALPRVPVLLFGPAGPSTPVGTAARDWDCRARNAEGPHCQSAQRVPGSFGTHPAMGWP